MFHSLGTPRGHKCLVVSETEHWIDHRETTMETLARFDNSMGSVAAGR